MTDILVTKIHNTFETYTQNIRPFLSGVLNHVHGIQNLDKTTLTDLLEQATDHTEVFQQNFVNGYNFFKTLHPGQQIDYLLQWIWIVPKCCAFSFCLCWGIGDWQRWLPCTKDLKGVWGKTGLLLWQTPTFFKHDTAIHHWAHGISDWDWDWGPSYPGQFPTHTQWHCQTSCGIPWHLNLMLTLNMTLNLTLKIKIFWQLNQLIPLDNYIDNIDPTFDNSLDSSISDCTDIKQTVDNSDIGDPNESETETIDDNMQDQTDNIAQC